MKQYTEPVAPRCKCVKFTRDYNEYREAVRFNDSIWAKWYREYVEQGYSRNRAADKARENVDRFRGRYPFPCFKVGG